LLEVQPVFEEWFFEVARELGGTESAIALARRDGLLYDQRVQERFDALTPEQRRQRGLNRPPFWSLPARTLDRATGYLPALMSERLDEFGIDFAMLYPSRALPMVSIPEAELRQLALRALNVYQARVHAEFSDRMRPVAVIPAHTPEEALAELEFVSSELGAKAALINGLIHRPLESGGSRLDTLAFDSEYDYEPLWQKLVEKRVVPCFHASGQGWGSRRSPSSYVFNHVGSFAASGEAICRSLFLGGVTRRHPELCFALLEGGVGYAVNLYADLVSHWEKRNADAIRSLDPARLDLKEMRSLFERYADARTLASLDRIETWLSRPEAAPDPLDEFAAVGAGSVEALRDLFAPRFYFGCEADDPMVVWAFQDRLNPAGATLRPMFSSDVGHWDVPEMEGVLSEAWELVEDGHLDPDQFRTFTFENAVRFYGSLDPGFFEGTRVEKAAAGILAAPQPD
ncbi:MAG TPA: amidohydrolase family protein, partial [Myxococcota bacterium]|nr:amidohydrolase family protein [Myxococcota bacterium]